MYHFYSGVCRMKGICYMHELVTAVRLSDIVCMSALVDFQKCHLIMSNMSIIPSCIMFLEIKDVFQ